MLNYSPSPSDANIILPDSAALFLNSIDKKLTIDIFHAASTIAYSRRREVTASFPVTAKGTLFYNFAVAEIRNALQFYNWILKDVHNSPLIISPNKEHAILTMSGSSDTGYESGLPSNKNETGNVLKGIVDKGGDFALHDLDARTKTWIFLYYVDLKNKNIRMELSQPSSFSQGKVTGWRTRVILPSLTIGDHNPSPKKKLAPIESEVVVERKKKAG